ncbi:MAG: bifunctional methylenetetrahydrofolate dehydrogenase/methenyltetrahydrofolate cyclohydrolase FolD [Candidatus Pacebacteria bacterium]|nr:bifunctional methylenetetrahydrofolate dehydrogenase/methenyltetrahydrofolate cyclohydrolase FolD [Candidatus Paceibacterota bacterium]
MTQLIDGRALSQEIKQKIKQEVEQADFQPGLAVVLVGDNPASKVYVNSKEKACQQLGFYSEKIVLPEKTTQSELMDEVNRLNQDPKIHGILVQLPLPDHLNEEAVINKINPQKDVDVFHPFNVGQLCLQKQLPELSQLLAPCTPKGIMRMLEETGVELEGKKAVVIGRSNLVGKPIALMLLAKNATVEICHSRTKDLAAQASQADVLVAAVGRPKFVTPEMVKDGAVVIDVGINRTEEGLVGDVDFEAVKDKAGYITPVPGGVGPMTIASLMENTLLLAKRHKSFNLR